MVLWMTHSNPFDVPSRTRRTAHDIDVEHGLSSFDWWLDSQLGRGIFCEWCDYRCHCRSWPSAVKWGCADWLELETWVPRKIKRYIEVEYNSNNFTFFVLTIIWSSLRGKTEIEEIQCLLHTICSMFWHLPNG